MVLIAMITGSIDLPLHSGKAPNWLMQLMKKLSLEISKSIIEIHGEDRFLQLLSDPLWFQSFGNVLGFDWHSSGVTTTTIAALKEINKMQYDIKIAGGKGKSKTIKEEIEKLCNKSNIDPEKIKYYSRFAAKVDNSLVQDSFSIYVHSIIFTKKHWAVIQQGKNNAYSRRYHWLDNAITIEPHTGVISNTFKKCLDLTAKENEIHQKTSVDLVKDGPIKIKSYFKASQTTLTNFMQYSMPARHKILPYDLDKRTYEALQKAYEINPKTYEELLNIPGIGPKTLRSLALISELINAKPLHYRNPAKYSFAHGGKDGIPYPINRKEYLKTIEILRDGINAIKDKKQRELTLKRFEKITNPEQD
ncbi:MAG: DUF763 domain-containing protein [Candidatus Woesearchaeota archaeon]